MACLNEFDFRYNHRKVNDLERMLLAQRATEGKRLNPTGTKKRFGIDWRRNRVQARLCR